MAAGRELAGSLCSNQSPEYHYPITRYSTSGGSIMAKQTSEQLARREMLAGMAAGALAVGLPLVEVGAAETPAKQAKLKVIVAGAHPDDPESAAGGTMARYADLGHDVVSLYLTRGEAGLKGKTHKEAADIRSAEADKACAILKVRPLFANQVDGSTEISNARYDEFRKLLAEEKPDVVFTHWPVDSHRDHRVTSMLVYDAWLNMGRKFALYYFEVDAGAQTQIFRPTHYVDITETEDRKKKACYAHTDGPGFYPQYHDLMNRFRGLECGHKYAEAFVQHYRGPEGMLPGKTG
jgi:N-acetylglucosamine malate deacetylase 1